jgi:hypothetical protein
MKPFQFEKPSDIKTKLAEINDLVLSHFKQTGDVNGACGDWKKACDLGLDTSCESYYKKCR